MALKTYDIIQDALIVIGALGVSDGDTLEAPIASAALRTLKGLIGEWSTKSIYNPVQFDRTCSPPTSPTAYIEMGEGGDIVERPAMVNEVQVSLGPAVHVIPVVSLTEYQRCFVKETTGIPQLCAVDYGFPLSRIYFWPIPLGNTSIRVIGFPSMPIPATVQSDLDYPDFWKEALVYNLAARLAPMLGLQVSQDVLAIANKAMSGIKRINTRMRAKRAANDFGDTVAGSYWTWAGRVV